MKLVLLFASLLMFLPKVQADCGVSDPAQSIADLQDLIARNGVRKLFSNEQGTFYLHYEEICCQSGIRHGDTTVYQMTKMAVIGHPLCEASGLFGKTFEVSGETLIVRIQADCTSGSGDECLANLPATQEEIDGNPIRLTWSGDHFVDTSKSR